MASSVMPLVAHGLERAELVERMKRCTLDVFGQGNLVDEDAEPFAIAIRRRGPGVVLLSRFCLASISSAR